MSLKFDQLDDDNDDDKCFRQKPCFRDFGVGILEEFDAAGGCKVVHLSCKL